jgi:gas vesicle protein
MMQERVMSTKSDTSSTNDNSGSATASWLFGLILGVVGGATLAFLTAPKSGSEFRSALQKTAKDVPDRLREIIDDSLDLYASALNYGQLVIEEQTSSIKRAVAAGQLAAAKKREELELGGSSVLPFQHR